MSENAKKEMLENEGNAYFERNLHDGKVDIAKGCLLFEEFLKGYTASKESMRILEIGCCYGYNLIYLCKKYGFEGHGIEPSNQDPISTGKYPQWECPYI